MAPVRLSLVALRLPADATLELVPVAGAQTAERAPKVVTKPETMNYRTLLPEPGGLFDPKLFGPGTVIDAPLPADDEPVKPRKTQFARITLAAPIVHPLAVAHAAGDVAALIGMSAADVERAGTSRTDGQRVVDALASADERLVMRELAVLPPDLRALRRDDEDRWATTPVNALYQRVISRNRRLEQLLSVPSTPAQLVDDEYHELHVAIRGLAENEDTPNPAHDGRGAALASLRTLAGGTNGLLARLDELATRPPSDEPLPGRLYIARAVLFALGFDLVAHA
jgi:DNA-directed RNA polymerase beta' subunit